MTIDTPEFTWNISRIEAETPLITSLYLESTANRPDFIAGQYVTVKLPNIGPTEGKSYSISSAPHETHIRLSIKRMGDFSSALLALQVGDTITTSAPYGFFYPEPDDATPLAFVMGGIGIAPGLSIIKHLSHISDPRPIHLIYINPTTTDTAFISELTDLAAANPHLTIHHFFTREEAAPPHHSGRPTPLQIISLINNPETDIFICGSMDFTRSLWKSLRDAGVPQHKLYTEGFF